MSNTGNRNITNNKNISRKNAVSRTASKSRNSGRNGRKSNNVLKFNKDIKINAATCVIAAVLLYSVICIIIASRKDPITTYKVNKSDISDNIILNGLIVRDEQIINTTKSGYVCYYIRDGEKIMKNCTVCTIDETGQLYNQLSDFDNYNSVLKAEDYEEIRSNISLYKVSYNNDSFYEAYNFNSSLNNKVLELTNEVLMQELSDSSSNIRMAKINSMYSGVVTYYVDGYEQYNINNVKKEDFDKSKYSKQTLKSGSVVSAGSPIVKIIPNEEWNILSAITTEQINSISENDYVTIRINNSTYTMDMPYEIVNGSDGQYINIKLSKYLSNFVDERFVDVEIIMDDKAGLKVPVSALVEKDVYKIPKSYFSGGSNEEGTNYLNIQVKDEATGEITLNQVKPYVYFSDDDYKYVDPDSFLSTDVILDVNTQKTIAISLVSSSSIKGVYSANRGIADFKMVDVIEIVDEFALISNDGELKEYDNIILDSSSVKENQIIY